VPHYTFQLRDGARLIQDPMGVQLRDRSAARDYAQQVARELMSGREPETRMWCLDVHEDDSAHVLAIPFATIDPTLDHLGPELRSVIETWCDKLRSLQEAVSTARATLRESRALVAQSRGRPYLATANGERTIRSG
jgi:hypothetical protein